MRGGGGEAEWYISMMLRGYDWYCTMGTSLIVQLLPSNKPHNLSTTTHYKTCDSWTVKLTTGVHYMCFNYWNTALNVGKCFWTSIICCLSLVHFQLQNGINSSKACGQRIKKMKVLIENLVWFLKQKNSSFLERSLCLYRIFLFTIHLKIFLCLEKGDCCALNHKLDVNQHIEFWLKDLLVLNIISRFSPIIHSRMEDSRWLEYQLDNQDW